MLVKHRNYEPIQPVPYASDSLSSSVGSEHPFGHQESLRRPGFENGQNTDGLTITAQAGWVPASSSSQTVPVSNHTAPIPKYHPACTSPQNSPSSAVQSVPAPVDLNGMAHLPFTFSAPVPRPTLSHSGTSTNLSDHDLHSPHFLGSTNHLDGGFRSTEEMTKPTEESSDPQTSPNTIFDASFLNFFGLSSGAIPSQYDHRGLHYPVLRPDYDPFKPMFQASVIGQPNSAQISPPGLIPDSMRNFWGVSNGDFMVGLGSGSDPAQASQSGRGSGRRAQGPWGIDESRHGSFSETVD